MSEQQISLRQSAAWGAVAFGVALAVVVGVRLDQAALAVTVGVACGVGASIPTGLLVVALMRRQDAAQRDERWVARSERPPPSPPVVVVAPPTAPPLPQSTTWPGAYAAPLPSQRQFAVIGEDELDVG
jgi:hypothetical protein